MNPYGDEWFDALIEGYREAVGGEVIHRDPDGVVIRADFSKRVRPLPPIDLTVDEANTVGEILGTHQWGVTSDGANQPLDRFENDVRAIYSPVCSHDKPLKFVSDRLVLCFECGATFEVEAL